MKAVRSQRTIRLIAIGLAQFTSLSAFAVNEGAQTFTYQGQFFNQAGTAPLLDNVNLLLEIRDPSGICLLYSEVQSGINLSLTNGTFALVIGSIIGDAKRNGSMPDADPGLAMNQVFSNTSLVRVDDHLTTNTCPGGYNPGSVVGNVDGRVLRVIMNDVTAATTVTLTPDLPIGAAPQAITSQTLQGIPASGFLQVDTNATQAHIDTLVAGAASDASSLHSHDSLYVKLGGGTLTGALSGTSITTSGNVTDGGTLAVTGATTLSSSLSEVGMAAPAVSAAGSGTIYFDSTSHTFQVSQNGGAYSTLATTGSLGNYLPLTGGTLTGGLIGTTVNTSGNIVDGGTLAVTGASTLTGNTSVGGTFGVTGATTLTGAATLNSSLSQVGMAAPAVSAAGSGEIYFDSGTHTFQVSQNGGAYSPLATTSSLGSYLPLAGGTLTGLMTGTAITTSGNITDGGTLSVTGTSTLTGNTSVGGTFGATGATTLSSTLAVTGATTLTGAATLNSSLSQVGMAAPAVSAVGSGEIYFDSTSHTFQVSQNGGAYSPVATTASIGSTYLPLSGGTMTGDIGMGGTHNIFNANSIGVGETALATAQRFEVPWLSGDSSTTAYVGSSNASNNMIALEVQSYSSYGILATSNSGIGVYGLSTSSNGLYGESSSSNGVSGNGTGTGNGVFGHANSTGIGVEGRSNGGISGFFQTSNISGTNASPTLVTQAINSQTADLFQAQNTAGTALVKITSSGNVGIGVTGPAATLDVAGQVHSQVYVSGATTAIDWNNGNVQTTSVNCNGVATQFSFANMLEGGSYTLIVTGGSPTGSCNFSAGTTVTPAGLTGFTFIPANVTPAVSSSTVYTFLRAGNIVYVSWITGFPAAS